MDVHDKWGEKMSDLIRRSDAVEVIKKNHYNVGGCGATLKVMIEQIKAIPSADRPRGEWENYKDEHRCSNCGEVVIDDWYDTDDWYNFCPNCGAKMKGADDE